MLAILLIFATFFALLPAQPAYAQEYVWRLTETVINPNNEEREFYGGGSNSAYYADERYKGKFLKLGVTENSFAIEDCWVDFNEEWYHITFDYTFESPPEVIVPGAPYPLKMNFSPGGKVTKGNPGAVFSYSSPSVAIGTEIPVPDNTFRSYPWAENPSSRSSMTWILNPPLIGSETVRTGATFSVYAYGGPSACLVQWIYRAESVAPDATPTPSGTRQEDAGTRTFTEDDFGKMKADVASLADSYWGDDYQKALLKEGFIGIVVNTGGEYSVYDYTGSRMRAGTPRALVNTAPDVQLIRIRDTLRTGQGSTMVVIFPRYYNEKSVIYLGSKSEIVFTRFGTTDQDITVSQTLVEMIRGWARLFIQNWSSGRHGFTVKAGTIICGIRGSDVLISLNPEYEAGTASVYEGHMDVTSTLTEQTLNLTEGQSVIVSGGGFSPILPLTQQDWDGMLVEAGMDELQPPSKDEFEGMLKTTGQPVQPEGTGVGTGVLALIIVVVLLVTAAVSAGIYLRMRLQRRSKERMFTVAVTPKTPPAFCSDCGSDITPGSIFCKNCGGRLMIFLLAACCLLITAGCTRQENTTRKADEIITVSFDFNTGDHGWSADFSDYSEEMEMKFDSGVADLPEELSHLGRGFMITGQNSSDDLFMFLKKRLDTQDGIIPNRTYQIVFNLEFATNAFSGSVGIGGSPAESVWVKVGAAPVEPIPVPLDQSGTNHFYILNVDKGSQNDEGLFAILIGNVAKTDGSEDFRYALKSISSEDREFFANSDEEGNIWVFIGTDSGFEGITKLYYTKIQVSLKDTGGFKPIGK